MLFDDSQSVKGFVSCTAFSQSKEISSDLCCFYKGGISHNENIMHSFQKFFIQIMNVYGGNGKKYFHEVKDGVFPIVVQVDWNTPSFTE